MNDKFVCQIKDVSTQMLAGLGISLLLVFWLAAVLFIGGLSSWMWWLVIGLVVVGWLVWRHYGKLKKTSLQVNGETLTYIADADKQQSYSIEDIAYFKVRYAYPNRSINLWPDRKIITLHMKDGQTIKLNYYYTNTEKLVDYLDRHNVQRRVSWL